MRKYAAICLMTIIFGGMTLTSGAQKKPAVTAPIQPATQGPQLKAQPQLHVPVRQLYEEMFTNGRYDLESQVFAPNCIVHFGNRTVPLREAVAEGKGWRNAAPNLRMQINQISTNGDMVTVSWTAI